MHALFPSLTIDELEGTTVNFSTMLQIVQNTTVEALKNLCNQKSVHFHNQQLKIIGPDILLVSQGGICMLLNTTCYFYTNESRQI